jgi:carboxyl-terminal processing protease
VKQLFVLILSFVLVVGSSVPVQAFQRRDATMAGYLLAEVIELIMLRYAGDPVTVDELVEAALRGMTETLDQYSIYLSAEELAQFTRALSGQLVGIGVSMSAREDGRIEIVRVLPGSPAKEAGVLPGDILLSVDGQDITGMSLDNIITLITNPDNERVIVGFDRGGIILTFNILKDEIRSPTVIVESLYNLQEAAGLNGLQGFRYMQINTVGLTTAADVQQALSQMQYENVQGLVLDLRGNTGGYLDVAVDIANLLVPRGIILQTVGPSGRRRTYSSRLDEVPFDNVVVLVNRFTASAAEAIAAALQDSGAAVIIGEPTFGKGLVQSVYAMRTGGAMKLTTEEYFRRNGGTINGVGVVPCILVERGIEGRDQVLRRGMEILTQGGL